MVQFQVNGRDIDANDVRANVDLEDGRKLVVLLGVDGVEAYVVEEDGFVLDLAGMTYVEILER